MAKSKKIEKVVEQFPSPYGSHQSMVDENLTKELGQDGKVMCKDGEGYYITKAVNLDNGAADPFRFSGKQPRDRQLRDAGWGSLVKNVEEAKESV